MEGTQDEAISISYLSRAEQGCAGNTAGFGSGGANSFSRRGEEGKKVVRDQSLGESYLHLTHLLPSEKVRGAGICCCSCRPVGASRGRIALDTTMGGLLPGHLEIPA